VQNPRLDAIKNGLTWQKGKGGEGKVRKNLENL